MPILLYGPVKYKRIFYMYMRVLNRTILSKGEWHAGRSILTGQVKKGNVQVRKEYRLNDCFDCYASSDNMVLKKDCLIVLVC